VRYDEHRNPFYVVSQGGPLGERVERIWHPDGPPQRQPEKPNYAEAPPQVYESELGAVLKELYQYVREKEEFKDGLVPEIPPKAEWVRWDL
jgi:nucleoporin NUP42